MHKQIDFTQQGGFPLYSDAVLGFMQEGYSDLAKSLVSLLGDNVIVSGVENQNGNLTSGWIIYGGELLPFRAGVSKDHFVVGSENATHLFEDGNSKEVVFSKYAQGSDAGIAISSLTRVSEYKSVSQLMSNFIQPDIQILTGTGTFLYRIETVRFSKQFALIQGYVRQTAQVSSDTTLRVDLPFVIDSSWQSTIQDGSSFNFVVQPPRHQIGESSHTHVPIRVSITRISGVSSLAFREFIPGFIVEGFSFSYFAKLQL